jgi:outer membrane immunogenic protein
MKKYLISAALVLGVSAPAMANEARVEVRGGYTSILSFSEGIIGAAAGYDYDLGSAAFIGAEASVDKVLNFAPLPEAAIGLTVRGGFKVADKTKLYANGGYSFGNGGSWHAGMGVQHKINNNIYAKLEHRRNFTSFGLDFDSTVIGFGITF